MEPAREKFVEPAEKDMDAEAGREPPVSDAESPTRDIADSLFTHDGRDRNCGCASTVSSSATEFIARSRSRLWCPSEPAVAVRLSRLLCGRSVELWRWPEKCERVEACEYGELSNTPPIGASGCCERACTTAIFASWPGEKKDRASSGESVVPMA